MEGAESKRWRSDAVAYLNSVNVTDTGLECSVTRLEFKIVGDVDPGEYNLVIRVPNRDRKTFSLAKRKIAVVAQEVSENA